MIEYQSGVVPERSQVISLYAVNRWSSANEPDRLMAALAGSDHIECAFHGENLVGLANAISDGNLVVYYPHLLIHPDQQGTGIGRKLMSRMFKKYGDFHQQTLLAVSGAAGFYERVGFKKTDAVVSMWIYDGRDH
ncbi:acetyltransferase (GNAT) family protein [Yoonia maricola]|uniref:Acetyltransferase (GNAT) family protein n=1 Tax=Yoonia maricola TaxID=420999 RepID=A0A2M8W2W3_9RHOB|nr:GNAT family N-acetyltransferase [Yoonia maricola]PJI85257.1 acetyltransferase (GNAT) family protein [Yoonia maricola]